MCLERPRHSPEEGGTSVRVVWPRADEGAQPGGEAARLRAGRRLLLDGGEMQPRLGSERQPRGSREAAEIGIRGPVLAPAPRRRRGRSRDRPAGRSGRRRGQRGVSRAARERSRAARRPAGGLQEVSGNGQGKCLGGGRSRTARRPARTSPCGTGRTAQPHRRASRKSRGLVGTCPGRVLDVSWPSGRFSEVPLAPCGGPVGVGNL